MLIAPGDSRGWISLAAFSGFDSGRCVWLISVVPVLFDITRFSRIVRVGGEDLFGVFCFGWSGERRAAPEEGRRAQTGAMWRESGFAA